jgi:hypothetical protein
MSGNDEIIHVLDESKSQHIFSLVETGIEFVLAARAIYRLGKTLPLLRET